MGSLSSKNWGVNYFLWVIDVFTKYTWVKPLKDKKAKTILHGFIEILNGSNKITSIYNLDDWSKIPLNNFTFRNCLFGVINLVKNSDKSKYMYRVYEIEFDGAGPWSFDNYFARNAVIFGVNNSS